MSSSSEVTCFSCHLKGHISPNCPTNPTGGSRGGMAGGGNRGGGGIGGGSIVNNVVRGGGIVGTVGRGGASLGNGGSSVVRGVGGRGRPRGSGRGSGKTSSEFRSIGQDEMKIKRPRAPCP